MYTVGLGPEPEQLIYHTEDCVIGTLTEGVRVRNVSSIVYNCQLLSSLCNILARGPSSGMQYTILTHKNTVLYKKSTLF